MSGNGRWITAAALTLTELTIVGAMAFPGNATQARASASAAILDVRTGKLIALVDGHGVSTRRSSALLGTDRRSDRVHAEAREQALKELAERLNARLGRKG